MKFKNTNNQKKYNYIYLIERNFLMIQNFLMIGKDFQVGLIQERYIYIYIIFKF